MALVETASVEKEIAEIALVETEDLVKENVEIPVDAETVDEEKVDVVKEDGEISVEEETKDIHSAASSQMTQEQTPSILVEKSLTEDAQEAGYETPPPDETDKTSQVEKQSDEEEEPTENVEEGKDDHKAPSAGDLVAIENKTDAPRGEQEL